MPQQSYRANLSSAIFPLSISKAGRSVIIPGPDNVYDRRVDPEGEQKTAGIPQAIYMENVIPTVEGYQSVGILAKNSITLGATFPSRYIPFIYKVHSKIIALVEGISSYHAAYTNDQAVTGTWTADTGQRDAFSVVTSDWDPSQATLRGVEYIFTSSTAKLYTVATNLALTDITGSLSGITAANIKIILSSHNYLIAIQSSGTISWSSTLTATDFTASLVTGAGSATPNELRGTIVAAYNCPEGFIIYTTEGCIAATYTGNSRYPWKFREIVDAGKYSSALQIAAVKGSQIHYAIDVHGTIRVISAQGAQTVAPELSTFARSNKFYDSYSSDILTSTASGPYDYTLYYLLNRYLILGVSLDGTRLGTVNLFAFVYDTVQKRYGRLKHEFKYLWDDGISIYAINNEDGVVTKLTLDIEDGDADFTSSVLVLGKFKYARSRWIEPQEITIDGVRNTVSTAGITTALIPTLDGNRFEPAVTPSLFSMSAQSITYHCNISCHSFALALKGAFEVNSVEMKFSLGGAL
jgi:hypothetical protein